MTFDVDYWQFFDDLGTAWAVQQSPDGANVVTVRASDSLLQDLKDWYFNLLAHSVRDEDGSRFHAGFWARTYELLPYLRSLGRTRPLRLRGHSLGAALCVLSHYTLKREGFSDVKTLAAGCPRAIYRAARPDCLQGIVELQYGSDLVTKLPPWGRRAGTVIVQGGKRGKLLPSFRDHEPGNYEEMVRCLTF